MSKLIKHRGFIGIACWVISFLLTWPLGMDSVWAVTPLLVYLAAGVIIIVWQGFQLRRLER